MAVNIEHSWELPPSAARTLQCELASRIIKDSRLETVATVAGVDANCRNGEIRAAAVLLSFPRLELLEGHTAVMPAVYAYHPGLLSFHEGPAEMAVLRKLNVKPDLLLVHGHGIAHPRRLGLASHLGLLTGIPAIGLADSLLVGAYEEPDLKRGSYTPISDNGEIIGAALCTRDGVRPVFISVGHLVDLDTALSFTLSTCGRYKTPEPLRSARRRLRSLL